MPWYKNNTQFEMNYFIRQFDIHINFYYELVRLSFDPVHSFGFFFHFFLFVILKFPLTLGKL